MLWESDGTTYERGLWEYKASAWVKVGSASNSLGINYLSAANSTGESAISWITYADAAGVVPVNGVDGSPTITFAVNATTPLRGLKDMLFTKDAANRQGEGCSIAFVPDLADQGKIIDFTFDYKTSAAYVDDVVQIFMYDVTNSVLVYPIAGQNLKASTINASHKAQFQLPITCASARMILHVASTSSTASTFNIDNVRIGPQSGIANGVPVTDWTAYTATVAPGTSGSYTPSTITAYWKRMGSDLFVTVPPFTIVSVSSPVGVPTITIPSGLIIGTQSGSDLITNGDFTYYDDSANAYVPVYCYSSQGLTKVVIPAASSTAVPTAAANDSFRGTFRMPISGWSSNCVMSSDADGRVIAALITGDPASATSGNPIIVPTVSYDSHAAYNATTGRFTCPISGVYKVYGALASASAATTLTIYKNAVAGPLAGNLDSNGEATFVGAVNCNAGDILDIRPGGTVDATSMSLNFEKVSGPASIAASEKVYAAYSTNTATTMTNNTAVAVPYEDKVADSHNAYNIATGVYTCPRAGVLSLSAMAQLASDAGWGAGEQAILSVLINAVELILHDRRMDAALNPALVSMQGSIAAYPVVLGDTVTVKVKQISGGNINLSGTTANNHFELKID
jgi:hypothetical protein